MSVSGSDLREWIAVFLPELVPNGAGGDREIPPAILPYDVPAKVRQVSGNKVFRGDQVAQRVRYEITIRWNADYTASAHRVYWREKFLDIETIENVESRDEWMVLRCSQNEIGAQL